ncbi:MAG: DUF3800 domain-containing protein [Candidatus Gracilibacteria bacterium]|nr:DUF3800 domain-containing protein [Candidatus Gracilibacteria bacterium]
MIIYLDESKRLSKGQIVFGGFITKHSVSYVNKFLENKKKEYGFKNIDLELKSVEESGKIFYDRMITDSRFDIISNNILGISIKGYFADNKDKYIEILSILIGKIYNGIKNYNKDITIISDRLEFGKNNGKVEKEIMDFINQKYPLYKGYKFKFVNSKSYAGIQIADLIAYELRQVNMNKSKNFDDFILENMFNIDLSEITEI